MYLKPDTDFTLNCVMIGQMTSLSGFSEVICLVGWQVLVNLPLLEELTRNASPCTSIMSIQRSQIL